MMELLLLIILFHMQTFKFSRYCPYSFSCYALSLLTCNALFLATELTRGAKNLIQMSNNQTILDAPEIAPGTMSRSIEKTAKTFTFDKSYWSAGPRDDPAYASQQTLYDDLGKELLEHSFQGFNCCIFGWYSLPSF